MRSYVQMPPQMAAAPRTFAVAIALLSGALVGVTTTALMGLATVAYALMIGGLVMRRRAQDHVSMMAGALGLDLAVVLGLELSRHAVGTAVGLELGPWQQAHIYASTMAVILYAPLVVLGVRRLRGGAMPAFRWHAPLGMLAFGLRTLGFALMFSLLAKGGHP